MVGAGLRLASLAFSLVLALGLAFAAIGVSFLRAPGPATADTTVVLARGSGLNAIAAVLHQEGVVAHPQLFALYVRLAGDADALRAGEYRFPAGISAAEVTRQLVEGRTYKRRLTVPEGLPTERVLALIAAAPALQGDVPRTIAEGTLLPETYQYEWGDTRAALVARMQRAHADLVASLWGARDPSLPLQSVDQAVILASIVERETGVATERARIAAVFHNRLRMGMRLQSDPTVEYGLKLRGRADGVALTRDDLEADHPYNTYRIRGLPPGPIANPGRAALEAALNPLTTNELYFVADGTGGHAFAVTLEEHNRNVARYRASRDERAQLATQRD
jgi:UPF0755 protein